VCDVNVAVGFRCWDGRQPQFDVVSVSVDVLRTDTVLLQLDSTTTLERDQQRLIVGDKLFFDLIITASLRNTEQQQLDQYFDYPLKVLPTLHRRYVSLVMNVRTYFRKVT